MKALILMLGIVLIYGSFATGVGVAIYTAAFGGGAVAVAAWTGFKLWLSMYLGGWFLTLLGALVNE